MFSKWEWKQTCRKASSSLFPCFQNYTSILQLSHTQTHTDRNTVLFISVLLNKPAFFNYTYNSKVSLLRKVTLVPSLQSLHCPAPTLAQFTASKAKSQVMWPSGGKPCTMSCTPESHSKLTAPENMHCKASAQLL